MIFTGTRIVRALLIAAVSAQALLGYIHNALYTREFEQFHDHSDSDVAALGLDHLNIVRD